MDTLNSYRIIKQQSEQFIDNRHLYVASIIKQLFNPLEHKILCEIGAGQLELATILASSYERIDAFEPQLQFKPKRKIRNLHIYSSFDHFVNVSDYHLMISICPYCYAYDIFDNTDVEKETKSLITDILGLSVENNINSFVVLPSTHVSDEFIEEVKDNAQYRELVQDYIDLRYEKFGEKKTSHNKVLIYKKK